jgi:hypothetical protein
MQRVDGQAFVAAPREHDHRNLVHALLEPHERLQVGGVREAEVENHHVDAPAVDGVACRGRGGHVRDDEVWTLGGFEQHAQRRSRPNVVLNDEQVKSVSAYAGRGDHVCTDTPGMNSRT